MKQRWNNFKTDAGNIQILLPTTWVTNPTVGPSGYPLKLGGMVDEYKKIMETYQDCDYNVAKTARILRMNYNTLVARLKKYGVK